MTESNGMEHNNGIAFSRKDAYNALFRFDQNKELLEVSLRSPDLKQRASYISLKHL